MYLYFYIIYIFHRKFTLLLYLSLPLGKFELTRISSDNLENIFIFIHPLQMMRYECYQLYEQQFAVID